MLAWSDVGAFTGDGVLVSPIMAKHAGRRARQQRSSTTVARSAGWTPSLPEPQRNGAPSVGRKVSPTQRSRAPRAPVVIPTLRRARQATIHRYDHEILGVDSSCARLVGAAASDGPADGVVLAQPTGSARHRHRHRRQSRGSASTTRRRWPSPPVDEAVRNVVAVGADPDMVALLDNFSWGDPRRPSTLGELAAAVEGCCAAAYMYNAPFVSGKDSLNNEYIGNDGERHAVPPTLVITAVAHVPDANRCVTPDLAEAGNVLMLLGSTDSEFAGSHLDKVLGAPPVAGTAPAPDPDAPNRYRHLHAAMQAGLVAACHDVSEGGLAVALGEMCLAGRLGATIDVLPHDDLSTSLFSESLGRLVVEIEPRSVAAFKRIMDDECLEIGEVSESGMFRCPESNQFWSPISLMPSTTRPTPPTTDCRQRHEQGSRRRHRRAWHQP